MIQKETSEPRNAQSEMSQKLINQGEISTVKGNIQVAGNNQATMVQQKASGSEYSENPNSEENTNSSEYSADSNSNLIISKLNNSNESNATDERLETVNQAASTPQSESGEIDAGGQLTGLIDNFIESTPDIHFARAQQLFESKGSELNDLAVKTIKGIKRNAATGWVLIGIAAYCVWKDTQALPGGAYKVASPGEGMMQAIDKLAADCTENGLPVASQTLRDYIRRIRLLLEEPLKEFEKCDEETIRHQRTVLIKNLLDVPGTFARAAVSTKKPLEALQIACQKRAARGKDFTLDDYQESIAYLKTDENESKGIEADNTVQNNEAVMESANCASKELQPAAAGKAKKALRVDEAVSAQIITEATRVRLDPDQVKSLYISFLQTMLSILQNMGVEK